jgi:hypothetical protein
MGRVVPAAAAPIPAYVRRTTLPGAAIAAAALLVLGLREHGQVPVSMGDGDAEPDEGGGCDRGGGDGGPEQWGLLSESGQTPALPTIVK